jgi:hypothetical protein
MVTTLENLDRNRIPGDLDTEVELYCIQADSWEEVMQAYYDVEGLGTYKPMPA